MKFERIEVRAFGPLSELAWGTDEPLSSLVAIQGPNEAGKSAFHELLATLLYGFYPASREGNPWSPWDGRDADVEARLALRDGTELAVHRRLLSTPWAQLRHGDSVEQLRNDDLAAVRHVQRDVFRQVYALTLADLAGLEGRGWEAVQDRLLVGMGAHEVRSPREAVAEWAATAQGLWRPDRRGTPRHRRIRERLSDLRAAQRAAAERDRELRDDLVRAEELAAERERLRLRRAEVDELLQGARRLRPLRTRLDRLEELRGRMGDPAELQGIPADPGERLEELGRRLADEERSLARLDERLERARERAGGVRDEDRALLDRQAELVELAERAPLLRERALRRGELDEEIRGLERRVRETAAPLVDPGAPAPTAGALEALSIPELERCVSEAARAREKAERTRDRIRILSERRPGEAPRWFVPAGIALVPAGVMVVVLALLTADDALEWPGVLTGALLVVVGAWMFHQARAARTGDPHEREADALRKVMEEADTEAASALDRVAALLEGLPVRGEILREPTPTVVASLARLRDLLQDLGDRRAARDALARGDREVADRLGRVREALLPELSSDPVAALPELARRVAEAARRAEEADRASREAGQLMRDREPLGDRVSALSDELAGLRDAIGRAGGGDPAAPATLARVRERLRARAELARAEEALPREFPDLEELRERLTEAETEGASWLEDHDLSELEAEREALQERMEDLRAELAELRKEIEHLTRGETVDILGGEIELLEEELVRVRRERDRLHVLSRLVLRAERRFRDEHQPDLLRRAGEHLARITGDRYSRLVLETGENGSTFHLEAPHLPRTLPVASPLSTGTREQVYFALRLAIVDHLDHGREPLPLFLDEVLVNWDAGRRSRGVDLLAEMAADRQVFLFTCHPGLAREVAERGGDIVTLQGPGVAATP